MLTPLLNTKPLKNGPKQMLFILSIPASDSMNSTVQEQAVPELP